MLETASGSLLDEIGIKTRRSLAVQPRGPDEMDDLTRGSNRAPGGRRGASVCIFFVGELRSFLAPCTVCSIMTCTRLMKVDSIVHVVSLLSALGLGVIASPYRRGTNSASFHPSRSGPERTPVEVPGRLHWPAASQSLRKRPAVARNPGAPRQTRVRWRAVAAAVVVVMVLHGLTLMMAAPYVAVTSATEFQTLEWPGFVLVKVLVRCWSHYRCRCYFRGPCAVRRNQKPFAGSSDPGRLRTGDSLGLGRLGRPVGGDRPSRRPAVSSIQHPARWLLVERGCLKTPRLQAGCLNQGLNTLQGRTWLVCR